MVSTSVDQTSKMSHSYNTRSVTRRKTQLDTMMAEFNSIIEDVKINKTHVVNDAIRAIRLALECPEAFAHDSIVRDSVSYFVDVSLKYYGDDQRLVAAAEEFNMFMEYIATRPDYKA